MSGPIDVTGIIDQGKCGRYQRLLVALTALTIVFDGIDNQLLGISIPSIIREWNVPRSAFAPVVALGFAGMMVGGAVAGMIGDRVGRRTALLGSVALFGCATVAVAAADSMHALGALRFVAGIGLGGAMPNATALAAEYVPLRLRAMAVTLTIVCIPIGGTLAGMIAIPALPLFGWRAMFAIGGAVPLVAAAAMWNLMAESPRYLVRHPARWPELRRVLRRMGHAVSENDTFKGEPERDRGPMNPAAIFTPAFRRDTLGLWTAFFSCLLAVYLGFSWLPSILTDAGLGSTAASSGILVFNLGGVAGAIAGGFLIGRFGSRLTMLGMTAGAIVAAAALSRTSLEPASIHVILGLLAVTGGLINAVQTTMYALAAHAYPTALRATGVGSAVAIGRAGAILSGYAGPWALHAGGSGPFFVLMAAALCATWIALASVRSHLSRA